MFHVQIMTRWNGSILVHINYDKHKTALDELRTFELPYNQPQFPGVSVNNEIIAT